MSEEQEFLDEEEVTDEEIKEQIEAMVQAAVEEALVRYEEEPALEVAEPLRRWNLWAYGPIQPRRYRRPHRVIRTRESFFVATVLWLNPRFPADVSTCEELTNLGAQFKVRYCTGEVCDWKKGPAELNVTHTVSMVPNKCWYVDILRARARSGWEGCYEMSICGQIVPGCTFPGKLPYAGYASAVLNLDWDKFYPRWPPPGWPRPPWPGMVPHWEWGQPAKFMIYS